MESSEELINAIESYSICVSCNEYSGSFHQCMNSHTLCTQCISKMCQCPLCYSNKGWFKNRALLGISEMLEHKISGPRFFI